MVEVVEDGGGLLLIVEGEGRRVPVPFVKEFLRRVDVAAGEIDLDAAAGAARGMRVDVLTIFPELFAPFLATSLIGRAREKGLLEVRVHDLRGFTEDRHRSVDDEPYGGGGGMVMTAPPWIRAVRAVSRMRRGRAPGGCCSRRRGRGSTTPRCASWPRAEAELVLLCGRYEGIDERVRETVVDEEVSIGDYVLSGGELPAMVLIEALSRQVPGVVGLADSVANDSFRGRPARPPALHPAAGGGGAGGAGGPDLGGPRGDPALAGARGAAGDAGEAAGPAGGELGRPDDRLRSRARRNRNNDGTAPLVGTSG